MLTDQNSIHPGNDGITRSSERAIEPLSSQRQVRGPGDSAAQSLAHRPPFFERSDETPSSLWEFSDRVSL